MFILTCSSRKKKGQHMAKDLYVGNSVNSPIKYANKFYGDDWYILSAKYGVIKSNTIIEDYNISFSKPQTNSITPTQINLKFPDPCIDIELIGGKNYIKILQEAWPNSNIKNPFKDYGINYQGMWRRALKDAYNKGINFHYLLETDYQKYIPTKLNNDGVKKWIKNNYTRERSMIKLAHIFRDEGYSCDEHRWERLYKEINPYSLEIYSSYELK